MQNYEKVGKMSMNIRKIPENLQKKSDKTRRFGELRPCEVAIQGHTRGFPG